VNRPAPGAWEHFAHGSGGLARTRPQR
jgi:hypothetical protein